MICMVFYVVFSHQFDSISAASAPIQDLLDLNLQALRPPQHSFKQDHHRNNGQRSERNNEMQSG